MFPIPCPFIALYTRNLAPALTGFRPEGALALSRSTLPRVKDYVLAHALSVSRCSFDIRAASPSRLSRTRVRWPRACLPTVVEAAAILATCQLCFRARSNRSFTLADAALLTDSSSRSFSLADFRKLAWRSRIVRWTGCSSTS